MGCCGRAEIAFEPEQRLLDDVPRKQRNDYGNRRYDRYAKGKRQEERVKNVDHAIKRKFVREICLNRYVKV